MTPAAPTQPGPHVLVVDDDRDVCETFRDILELEGYTVTVGLSGHQALELAERSTPDAVLLDVKMPVLDGVETCRRLKADHPDLPVIMITAHAVQDRIDEALQLGALAALRKPVRVAELLTILGTALETVAK